MERSNVDQQHLTSNKTYRITFHAAEDGAWFAYVRINGRLPFMCGAGPLERVRREAEEWVARAVALDTITAGLGASARRRLEQLKLHAGEHPVMTDEAARAELGAVPPTEVR